MKRFSILLGLVFLSASALADGEAEIVFGSSGGELAVGTRDEHGKPGDPVRFRYAFESHASAASEKKALENLIAALPDDGTVHAVDVFVEDTPEGRKVGERTVARLRAIAKKLETRHGARVRRVSIEAVPVPVELVTLEENVAENAGKAFAAVAGEKGESTFRKAFQKALVRPSEYDVRTGAIVGSYRGITSFSTWFATPGIHPLVATGLATFQTTLSTFHAVFARSMSNAFKLSVAKPGGSVGAGAVFVRRQLYGILIGEVTRLLSGTPPGFDPINTWAGQAQIISFSLALGGLDALMMGARDRAFLNDPIHFARLYLANFFLLTPWQALDAAGTFPVILDLTVYKVRATTLGMLATYFGLYQAVTRAPDKVALILDTIIDPVEKSLGRIQRTLGKSCRWVFHLADDVGDHFRDFVR